MTISFTTVCYRRPVCVYKDLGSPFPGSLFQAFATPIKSATAITLTLFLTIHIHNPNPSGCRPCEWWKLGIATPGNGHPGSGDPVPTKN